MHVVTNTVKRGDREYHSHLLRRSYREDGKVKKQTLANLSHLPPEAIAAIRSVLAGKALVSRSLSGSPTPSPPGTPRRCWAPPPASAFPACSIVPPAKSATWPWR